MVADLTLLLFSLASGGDYPFSDEQLAHHPGRAIYQKVCVDCHGEKGEGVEDKADDPLYGNRSLASLAGRIVRTMPEDREDECVSSDADAVAEYIYFAFYSPEARARNAGARRSLTHLTVAQYRNSVADLVGNFRNQFNFQPSERRGLQGFYYANRKYRKEKKNTGADYFERLDPVIRFDFGKGPPKAPKGRKFQPDEFSIRWTGSIMARETGVYEFTVRTRNGAALSVNENDAEKSKLIDAWVAPNNEIREKKGRLFLIGGRAYPLEIEYFKYQEDKGFFELLWKPPHGVEETVPRRVLCPDRSRETLVIDTPFPADDWSFGYERGASVSREWLDAVVAGASEAADYVVKHIDELAHTKSGDPKRAEKMEAFGLRFTETAFRRPLREDERAAIVGKRFHNVKTLEDAVRRLTLFVLTSPQFLYPDTSFEKMDTPWAKVSALAMTLWDSLPSRQLNERLRKGQLKRPEQLQKTAWEMVFDPRCRNKVHRFFGEWLELERANEINKDHDTFPEFSPRVMADLRTSLNLFLDEVMWKENSDYRNLLLDDCLFLNPELAKIYGANLKAANSPEFQKVSMSGQQRAGIITHPFLLTTLAYHNSTDPIHRGVFLTRNVVGMSLKPPPKATKFEGSRFKKFLTMREKVTEMTRAKACMACHTTINPLGFSLEHFDGIGRFRTKEANNRPIDDDGKLALDGGRVIPIQGPRDVADFAANDPGAQRSFLRQLFQYFVKQSPHVFGPDTMDRLEKQFADSGFRVRDLMVNVALTSTQIQPPEKQKKTALAASSTDQKNKNQK